MVVPPNLTRERRRVGSGGQYGPQREHSTAAHALEGVGHFDKDSKPVLVETRLLPPLARVCGLWLCMGLGFGRVRGESARRTKKLNRDLTCEAMGLSDPWGLRGAMMEAPRDRRRTSHGTWP